MEQSSNETMMRKIITVEQVGFVASRLKEKGNTIVLAGGCFDILHTGHISFLENAKKSGDVLILLLESDLAIKKLKGEKRPINNQENRAKVLSSVEFVDFIVLLERPLENEDYQKLTMEIRPDVIAVTAGDPNIENKKQQAKKVGGIVKVVLKQIPEHSTTKLLEYF